MDMMKQVFYIFVRFFNLIYWISYRSLVIVVVNCQVVYIWFLVKRREILDGFYFFQVEFFVFLWFLYLCIDNYYIVQVLV